MRNLSHLNDVITVGQYAVSFAFFLGGKYHYLLKDINDYATLRRKMILYYRMTGFTQSDDGIFQCVMEAENGKKVIMHFRPEDVYDNLQLVGGVMDLTGVGIPAS